MFSTMPRIGTFTWWNMCTALRASSSETSEGVVTTTAPVIGAVWISDSCTSPVPGGRSMTQVIEFAPIHAAQELLDDAVQHGAAPDQRLVAGIQESHRHQLHAVLLERLDAVAVRHRRAVDAHHQRHVGAVDVGVHQADGMAEFGQRDGEVHRNGGFADAAFAGTDGDEILDAGDRQLGQAVPAGWES